MNTTSARSSRAATFAAGALGTALAVGLLAGCGAGPQDATTTAATVEAAPESGPEPLTYEGEDGQTALDLLLRYDSEAEVSGTGENAYVTGVGGYLADEDKSEFWSLLVDDEPAQVGAGTLETEDGQEITWTLETY